MTKKEMVTNIAKCVEGTAKDKTYAIDYAVGHNKLARIEQVYRYWKFHKEDSGFCMCALTGGMQFQTKEDQFAVGTKFAISNDGYGIVLPTTTKTQ